MIYLVDIVAASNSEQVLEATPNKAAAIRPPTTHHENYQSLTKQTCRTLLEKQGWAHKWCSPMEPLTWPSKSRTAGSKLHTLCRYGILPENLPEAMNDRVEWRERVRDICAGGTTRWWWCLFQIIWFSLIQLEWKSHR